jgi:1-acyl-sn-glycerol-3-phosphate acyltransferase
MVRCLFFALIVRPLCLVILGMNVRHRERLPREGPAIVVANHNSHLDTLVLITLFPLRKLRLLRPVAAQDYFFRNPFLKWFALNVIGIIPIQRCGTFAASPLEPVEQALDEGEIVILFPEGSRGDAEKPAEFKSGVAHLARARPGVPIFPVYMHGLGKALPRGEALLVPFFCDVFVGEPLSWCGNRIAFMQALKERMTVLAEEGDFPAWD